MAQGQAAKGRKTGSGKQDGVGAQTGVKPPFAEPKESSARRAVWPAKVKKAVAYMDKSFAEHICLGDVADLVGMDKTSFCRLFKKETQMTFTQYLNRVRLEQAKELLLSSHFYVFQVAHRAGFSGVRYFRRAFRRRYGCSPRQYRDLAQPSGR